MAAKRGSWTVTAVDGVAVDGKQCRRSSPFWPSSADEHAEATFEVGHVLTIEPGLYFSHYDGYVPAHLRGIGVRIQDDDVVTGTGNEVLSDAIPTTADSLEHWLVSLA